MDAITIKDLVVERGGKTILHDMTASLPKGKITAIVGPNGCGKSTFLKAVNCMIPISGGAIDLFGRDVRSFSRKALSREIAFLTQSHDLPQDVPVAELVAMGRFPYRRLLSPLTKEDQAAIHRAMTPSAFGAMKKAHDSTFPAVNSSGPGWPFCWLRMRPFSSLTSRRPILTSAINCGFYHSFVRLTKHGGERWSSSSTI